MAPRTRRRICSSWIFSSAGSCESSTWSPSVPSRLVAKTMARPLTALEISRTSSSSDDPPPPRSERLVM